MTSQSAQSRILLQTDFPELTLHARGKVRDLYSLNEQLLFVATDRISAFDYVLATGIPEKGRVLTQLSLFWFDFLKDVVKNHLVTANVEQYPAPLKKYADDLRGRSMLVTKAQMIDIECVARGYLSGSGWKEYQQTGAVCGIKLPVGPERIRQAAGTDLYAGHQSAERPRRKYFHRGNGQAHGKRAGRETARFDVKDLYRQRPTMQPVAASSLPTPNLSSATHRRASSWRMKSLRRIHRVSGRQTNISRAKRRNLLTSNLFAIIWKRSSGTSNRLRLHCRKMLRARQARST